MEKNIEIAEYPTIRKKVGHFLLGVLINLIVTVVFYASYWAVFYLIAPVADNAVGAARMLLIGGILIPIVFILTESVLIRKYLRSKRYIGIGLITSLIIPLLTTGFCSIVWWGGF